MLPITRDALESDEFVTDKSPHRSEEKPFNASRSVASGVAWAVLMRWALRFIGLFSTLILARLLSPEDFGIAAMGMLVMNFLFELSHFGAGMHLIRRKQIDQAHSDSAWTMTFIQGLLTSVLLFVIAVPVSTYFKEPRVIEVMYFLAVASLIGGLESMGPVLLRRELNFSADFRFNVWKKVLSFISTVSAALILRNYWALILGHVVGKLAGVALSYRVHSYRPRFSLEHAKEYLIFSASIIPIRIANTSRGMIAQFLVGGAHDASALGSFRVATDLSTLFTSEIVTPMGRGLLPNYSRLADQPDELSSLYYKILGMVALLCIPVGVGASAVAEDVVLVLLGPQWGFAAGLMEYLAVGGVVYAISQTMVNQILVATGREKSAAVLAWVRLAITAPILWIGLEFGGMLGLAKATVIAPIVCLPVIFNETRQAVTLTVTILGRLLWRPTIGAIAMYIAIKAMHNPQIEWAIVRLLTDVLVGGVVFVGVTTTLWAMSGRPDSAETTVINTSVKLLDKVRNKIGR